MEYNEGLVNYSQSDKSSLLPISVVKFYLNVATLIHKPSVYGRAE